MIKKIHRTINKVAEIVSVIAIILLALTLFTGVLSRYVFSYSIPELEVIRNFAITWLVFMGSSIALKEKEHLDIDIFVDYLSEKWIKIKRYVVYILTLISIILLIFIGIEAFKAGLNRSELISIRFLSSPPSLIYYYSAILVGSLFMLYFHLLAAKDFFKMNRRDE